MSTMDLRQSLAGLLTLSMFIMLGNMIKKDHFDSVDVDLPTAPVTIGQNLVTVSHNVVKGPWKHNGQGLKPCWNPPPLNAEEAEQSKGFITFSLTDGPEYHISQIADAVVVARYLGATLVLPNIKDTKSGYNINLGDVYDVQNILNALGGFVRVTRTISSTVESKGNFPIVKVPNMVSEDYIVKEVLPMYKSKGIVKIESYFPSSITTTMTGEKMMNNKMDSIACHAMFGTLQLQSDIQQLVDSMVQKLQTWSQNLHSQFVAVDLRDEGFEKECLRRDDAGRKVCYQAKEIGEFLKKIGFGKDTVIYVTQAKQGQDLGALKDMFPKTYTKEGVMSEDEKGRFIGSKSSEIEKIFDFYICSQSDVFVASIPNLFYTNVAAMRIASGNNQILVPSSHSSPSHYLSPYVSQKSHFAYSCFCQNALKGTA